MTKRAFVSQAELQRMAKVAKLEGVTVWVEIDGKRFGITPEAPVESKAPRDRQPNDFATLAQWQAWKDLERARKELAAIESKQAN
ncbi:hypothetical protein C7U61_14490 [Rhizobium sp. JAB6]|uniref:hypothetical protein n=1 Tax=Rhizobium sp. JAB6 TaxID=2127050 RepID=UPI000D11E040|nr:hypothetical protein [Rhizobium sp. JAB6]PST19700.1 hypothetical protein C7U61_14490 [Rhizobium sp. JAB6]